MRIHILYKIVYFYGNERVNTQSTYIPVPRVPPRTHPLPQASVSSPRTKGGTHTRLRVRGWGGSQFGRLEKKPSTLSTLRVNSLASGSDKNESKHKGKSNNIFYSLFPPVNVLGLASNDVRKRGANWTNLSHWVIPGDFRLGADSPMVSFSGRWLCIFV
jgi:hypothetical protein